MAAVTEIAIDAATGGSTSQPPCNPLNDLEVPPPSPTARCLTSVIKSWQMTGDADPPPPQSFFPLEPQIVQSNDKHVPAAPFPGTDVAICVPNPVTRVSSDESIVACVKFRGSSLNLEYLVFIWFREITNTS